MMKIMMDNNARVTCFFCSECVTLCTHFSAFKCSKCSYCGQWEWQLDGLGIKMSGKSRMGMRCWTGNGLDGNGNDSTGMCGNVNNKSHFHTLLVAMAM